MRKDVLKKEESRIQPMGFKVSDIEHKEIKKFVDDRDWKLSTFLRNCVIDGMEKVKKEEG